MTSDEVIAAALHSLAGIKHAHADAIRLVPKQAGLYAFYGDGRAWAELKLSPALDGQPLYIGKAERSLNGRDVGTHFALTAVPRNLAKPDGSAQLRTGHCQRGPLEPLHGAAPVVSDLEQT